MSRMPESKHLGWHVISGENLLVMLRRVREGESPDMVFAEAYANAEVRVESEGEYRNFVYRGGDAERPSSNHRTLAAALAWVKSLRARA